MILVVLSVALLFFVLVALFFAFRVRQIGFINKGLEMRLNGLIDTGLQIRDVQEANLKLIQKYGALISIDDEKEKLLAELTRIKTGVQHSIIKAQEKQKELEFDFTVQKQRNEAEITAEKGRLEGEINSLKTKVNALRTALATIEERSEMAEFGFYQTKYDFITSGAYAAKLEEIRDKQKRMIKEKTAATGSVEWTVNGSKAEGKKQINQTLKLLLRAFNGESDSAVARVKYNNFSVMEARIRKAYDAVNSLAEVQQCRISPLYLDLKIQELHLAHEFQEKVQSEKEEQRLIREQMREEEAALRELEKAKADAERDERLAFQALEKARAEVASAVGQRQNVLLSQIAMLEQRLEEAKTNKERAISRAQMTRSGHVYVISNIGSFGEDVYKIGMTRRLDPRERIHELGNASVPFRFDVHAIIYSDDAPSLEATLHRTFASYRVNAVNERREFFRVSLAEIAGVVRKNHGQIEFIEVAEAIEYRKSLALRAAH